MVRRKRAPSPLFARALMAGLIGLGLVAGGAAGPAAAQNDVEDKKSRVDKRVDSLQAKFENLSRDLATAVAKLEDAKDRLPAAKHDVAEADAALQTAKDRDRRLSGKLDDAQDAEQRATEKLHQAERSIEDNRGEVAELARRSYRNGGISSNTAMWLQAARGEHMVDSVSMVSAAVRAQKNVLDELQQRRAVKRNAHTRLAAVKAKVAKLKKKAAASVVVRQAAAKKADEVAADLSDLIDTKKTQSSKLSAAKTKAKGRLSKERAEQKELAEEIRRQQKRAAKRRAAQRRKARRQAQANSESGSSGSSGESSGSSGSSGGSYFSNPGAGYPITSNFGYRYHPISHTRKLHAGTDFGVPCGTTVRAAAPGRVMRASFRVGAGNVVVIDHGTVDGASVATAYKHNTRFLVHAGEHVKRGQPISISGSTGWSTGCHLHFEVLKNGHYTNPLNWL